jgi:hypothetical protein
MNNIKDKNDNTIGRISGDRIEDQTGLTVGWINEDRIKDQNDQTIGWINKAEDSLGGSALLNLLVKK